MSTSTGKTISLPTINEVEGYKTTEGLINFLRDQNIGLEDKHFNILREQEVDDETFLRLNMDKLMKADVKLGPAEKISKVIEKIKGEDQAGPGVVKFWKKLPDAKIIFPIPEDMDKTELSALESYFTIENNYLCLNKGVTTDSDGMLYDNRKKTELKLAPILMNGFGGMLCLPDDVFFLGRKTYGSKLLIQNCYLQLFELIEMNHKFNGPAQNGCVITGTPGIGKTYFGLYLLFYIHYIYPNAIIIWQSNKQFCYQFLPDDTVQEGDISLFRRTLDSPDNFLIVDAQTLEVEYTAYTILLTSPRGERFNEAIKWSGFSKYFMSVWETDEMFTLWNHIYKTQKNHKGEEFTYKLYKSLLEMWGPIPRSVLLKWKDDQQVIFKQLIINADLEKCMNSFDKDGMPTDSISGRLVHIYVKSNFSVPLYRFASPMISNELIRRYPDKARRSVRNFITSSYKHPMATGFRGNLFEDYSHLELQKGGKFRVRCLNDNSEAKVRHIKEMECKWFSTLGDAHKEFYNRPILKTFASIDSFSLDNNTLNLYQMTVSGEHGMKIKGLEDLCHLLTWREDVNYFNLYFVVPQDIFETFPLQKYKTTKYEDCQRIPK
ncbi:10980_t:CDS:2 [Cetraspora pellucida]|uniref:10980_t:CDS:1 n=1 Tax=Cetraspora pellucida TaxID=1433469 RepID=A0A9N9FH01_9GLOM|nr:10980_t:CDS:2 [Cetraspora pellucida]